MISRSVEGVLVSIEDSINIGFVVFRALRALDVL